MNTFLFKFCLISCLFKTNQANSSASPLDSDFWPVVNKSVSHRDAIYYIAGGKREPDSLKLVKAIVSIRTRNPQKYFGDNHFCAGTIISKTSVLTSAHCIMDKRRVLTKPRRLLVVAGTPNRLEPIETTVQFPIKSVVANTNFVRNNKNDIAIIHLKYEFPKNNENIKIVKMPKGPPVYNTSCTVLGWGRMLWKGPLAALPAHVNVRLLQPFECKNFLKAHYYNGILCAGDSIESDEDPCRGDTGGPLICNEELTGIISWTLGCGTTHFPSLYTDVWYHRKWIEDHLNAASFTYITNNVLIILVVLFNVY